MNELAHQLRYDVAATGGLHSCDLGEINHRLRRILLGKAGYSYPIELAARRLAADEAGRDR